MTRLGWCIANQHIGIETRNAKGSRCPGRAWNIPCDCPCHTDPVAIEAEKKLSANYVPEKSTMFAPGERFGEPLPKPPLKLQKRKKKSNA